ncbi:MAG: phenylacetic acid degradation protein [Chloroflexota bacterium]
MSQWPRYEVFQQDKEGRPHQNAGSVHAPDAEMALQNARDVFVRRPNCLSLWVVPAAAIFAKTAQELAEDDTWQEELDSNTDQETYYVFQKQSQRRAMTYVTHVGEVEASSPAQALQRALQKYKGGTPYVWWVCPARAIFRSETADVESMFAPAHDKTFRMPNEYRVVAQMYEIRQGE